jgi:hypothetical protein
MTRCPTRSPATKIGVPLDVDERTVLPGSSCDGPDLLALGHPLGEACRFGTEFIGLADEFVEVPTQSLLRRVSEQPLRGRIPLRDTVDLVDGHDGRRAEVDQSLVVTPLLLQLTDVHVDHAVTDALPADEDRRRHQLHVDQGAILPRPPDGPPSGLPSRSGFVVFRSVVPELW